MKVLDDAGLQYHVQKIKSLFNTEKTARESADTTINARIDSLETEVDGKEEKGHKHPSSDITTMGSYSKGSSSAAIATTDSLNVAVGKLEYGLGLKAPLASPTFTGTPKAPTATAGTNTTQVATTAFVQTAVANVVNSAPAALDTLKELSDALGGDANFATTVATQIGEKLDADSADYIKDLSINGKVITYTKGDDTTGTLTTQDTTYGAGTAALLTAGTDTANRVWTAKILHDALPVTMTGATASAAGNGGLVPAPAAGKQTSFLRGDGTWVVPTDTNTHSTTHLYAGSGTAANAATTNGNTKITVTDDSTVRNSVTIKGTGATSVTSDASGVITVNSPAYSAMTATELTTGTSTTARVITAKVIADYVGGLLPVALTDSEIEAIWNGSNS